MTPHQENDSSRSESGDVIPHSEAVLEQRSSDLAAEARNGSPRALAELFQRHAKLVYRVAFRLTGNTYDADDVVQDVFLGLPEALRSFEARGSLEAWLHRVATRTTLMRLRRQKTTEELQPSHASVGSRDEAVASTMVIHDALSRLPVELRTVFVLNKIEGYSHAEIAELLGIRIGTSEVRLHRAIRQLRVLLENAL